MLRFVLCFGLRHGSSFISTVSALVHPFTSFSRMSRVLVFISSAALGCTRLPWQSDLAASYDGVVFLFLLADRSSEVPCQN